MKYLISTIISFIIVYGGTCFVKWNINPFAIIEEEPKVYLIFLFVSLSIILPQFYDLFELQRKWEKRLEESYKQNKY